LINQKRTTVVWLGDASGIGDIQQEFGRWGMRTRAVASDHFDPEEASTRAVLLPFIPDKQQFSKAVSHAASAINSGALVGTLVTDASQLPAAKLLAKDLSRDVFTQIEVFNPDALHELARKCSDHDPGREVRKNLQIVGDGDLEQRHRILLRRAFNDFDKIIVSKLSGGRSEAAGVWRVSCYNDEGWEREPFVVKVGSKQQIKIELLAHTNASGFVPFPHYPPVVPDRCVSGLTDSLIVTMFVDRVTRLDDYLRFNAPSLAISAILDGPLRIWRGNRKSGEKMQLAKEFQRCGVIPKIDRAGDLQTSYEAAKVHKAQLPNPQDLVSRLVSFPPVNISVCWPHGDLHTRNIFVRRNSLDVVLIDFAGSRDLGPAARDLAALDVSIGFDVANANGEWLEDETLRGLFSHPILPCLSASRDGRIDAIRQLRSHAMGEAIGISEYETALACHLLRFAKFPTPPEALHGTAELKAIAYELAADLVLSIQESIVSTAPRRASLSSILREIVRWLKG
jgi:hypothetical protein